MSYRAAEPPADYVRPDEPLPRPVWVVALADPREALIQSVVHGDFLYGLRLVEAGLVSEDLHTLVLRTKLWLDGHRLRPVG